MATGVQAANEQAFTGNFRPEAAERRNFCRYRTVFRVAKVATANDVGLWRVSNISDQGMMLHTHLPLAKGEPLSISLSGKVTLAGKVVWCEDGRCGVEFDEPIDCAALLKAVVAEQRSPDYRPPRLPVDLRALAYCDRGIHTVRISNVSHHGVGFAHDGCFSEGMNALLLFENGVERRGVVRWSADGRAGLYLVEPLTCAELASASRLCA